MNLLDGNKCSLKIICFGSITVEDLDWVHPSWYSEDMAVVEVSTKLVCIECGRCYDQSQVFPVMKRLFEETEKHVSMDASFVGFIENYHRVSSK